MTILSTAVRSIKTSIRSIGNLMTPPPRRAPIGCTNITALLMHLCDFDQELYMFMIKWLAYPLQHPGMRMETGVIINGPEGSGMTLFFDRIAAALHGPNARHIDESSLSGTFNAWASGAHFVVVDGRIPRRALPTLKSLITAPCITIQTKGQPAYVEENCANFVFVSSSPDFLPVMSGDRRFLVIEAPPKRGPQFYRAIADEIQNGGIEAFRDYLIRTVDLSSFNQFVYPPAPSSITRDRKSA